MRKILLNVDMASSSDFIFNVDGKQAFKSDTLQGTDGGKNVDALKVEFDIPSKR